jgi:hypothetical protein
VPEVTVSHRESWVLEIRPGEADRWPDRPRPYATSGQVYRPGRVTVMLTRGEQKPSITASGSVLNSAGTPGKRSTSERFDQFTAAPRWLADLVRGARISHGLTPDRTDVGW